MAAMRGPPSDPRDGRLLRLIRHAFTAIEPELAATTSFLISWCYPHEHACGEIKIWHRVMVKGAASKVARPIGRSQTGSGRAIIWRAIPELMQQRSWLGRTNRKRQRRGLPPLD